MIVQPVNQLEGRGFFKAECVWFSFESSYGVNFKVKPSFRKAPQQKRDLLEAGKFQNLYECYQQRKAELSKGPAIPFLELNGGVAAHWS